MSRPSAYKGNEPYIFVSYCHMDDARVWPMIEGLQKRGMRVWYDEGIEWGSHWDQVIFEHLSGCACVVAFVTENFLQSENCMDEISYAKDEQKGPFIVFLDNLELTGMMKFRYGRIQALNLHRFADKDALLDTLVSTQILSACCGTASQFVAPQQVAPADKITRPSEADLEVWYRKGVECYNRQEYAEAVSWYRKAAERGYALAQCYLGYCFANEKGVIKDETEAASWYRKAAEQGQAAAQFNLANCYLFGRGVARDEAEAVKWYRKAAEQGYAEGQYYLGCCYRDGVGVTEDGAEAIRLYRKAAEQGHADALYCIADCYYFGTSGVVRDCAEAIKWYRKAAEQGSLLAQAVLLRLDPTC